MPHLPYKPLHQAARTILKGTPNAATWEELLTGIGLKEQPTPRITNSGALALLNSYVAVSIARGHTDNIPIDSFKYLCLLNPQAFDNAFEGEGHSRRVLKEIKATNNVDYTKLQPTSTVRDLLRTGQPKPSFPALAEVYSQGLSYLLDEQSFADLTFANNCPDQPHLLYNEGSVLLYTAAGAFSHIALRTLDFERLVLHYPDFRKAYERRLRGCSPASMPHVEGLLTALAKEFIKLQQASVA